jgi:hypothetical protein
MNKTIILIAGKKRSGKNYTAEMLQSMLLKKNISCETFSFAEPLKDIVAKTFLISQSELEDYKNNPNRYKIMLKDNEGSNSRILTDFRQVLNDLGTPIMKSYFGDNIWVNLTENKIKKSQSKVIIISDFRFPVEKLQMKDIKVITIRVNKEGLEPSNLVSENSLNDFVFDYEIDNNVEGYSKLIIQLEGIIENILEEL